MSHHGGGNPNDPTNQDIIDEEMKRKLEELVKELPINRLANVKISNRYKQQSNATIDIPVPNKIKENANGVPLAKYQPIINSDHLFRQIESKIGPTNEYPEGKLTNEDEGELAFAVFGDKGKVIIDFSTPVRWIGFTPEQLMKLIKLLFKHAKEQSDKPLTLEL